VRFHWTAVELAAAVLRGIKLPKRPSTDCALPFRGNGRHQRFLFQRSGNVWNGLPDKKIESRAGQGSGKDGLEFPDRHAAWAEATEARGEMIRELNDFFEPGSEWHMMVTDENGRTVFKLSFVTESCE
jgi:hypothetical protein